MIEPTHFIVTRTLPTGRQIFVLKEIRSEADKAADKKVVKLCDQAIAQAEVTLKAEREYLKNGDAPTPTAETKRIDAILDREVALFHDGLTLHLESMSPEDPDYLRLAEMIANLFPGGVQAITRKPNVEQLTLCEHLISEAESYADLIDALAMRRPFENVVRTTASYRASMKKTTANTVEFSTIREHRRRGYEYLVEIIAVVLGSYPSSSQRDREYRTALLTPIADQNEALRQAQKNRRYAADVDPDTGAEEPADLPVETTAEAPAAEPVG